MTGIRHKLIVVYAHPLWQRVGVDLTLLHELAHASGRPGCVGHRRGFRRILARLANEQLGVDLGDPAEVADRYRSVAALEAAIWRRLLLVRLLGVVKAIWKVIAV